MTLEQRKILELGIANGGVIPTTNHTDNTTSCRFGSMSALNQLDDKGFVVRRKWEPSGSDWLITQKGREAYAEQPEPETQEWWLAKYRWDVKISPAQVQRHTDSSVWIDGARRARASDDETYFATRQEAFDCVVQAMDERIRRAEGTLARERAALAGFIDAYKEPS